MEWNKACLPCRLVHTTCDGKRPCRRCVKLGKPSTCINVEKKRRGRPPKNKSINGAAPATVASTAHRQRSDLDTLQNEALQRTMRPRKQPARHHYDETDDHSARRSSMRRRYSARRNTEAFSPSSSSAEEDDGDDDEDDDDDYRDYRSSTAGKKRKPATPPPSDTATATADTTTDVVMKRPRTEPQEQLTQNDPIASSETAYAAAAAATTAGVYDEQLPLLLDPVYSWIDDLDPIGAVPTDSDAYLTFPLFDIPAITAQPQSLPSSLNSPQLSPPATARPPQQTVGARGPTSSNEVDPYPPLPSPSFEFRDGLDDEYDGVDAEDGHDHDHDCTCSSPHSCSSSLSSFSGDAADAQLVNSLFGMMTDQVGELKKANEELRESIDTLWVTFNERLDREEKRVTELSQIVSTRITPTATPPPADQPSPSARPEVFRELPFLLDWADDIDFANPDGFVIDDMNKPFIVRRLFEPTPDAMQCLPVSIYASPAFCKFTRAPPHEIVGTLCYKAQEEPLRWFLAKKCPRPVGELCFLPLVRQIGDRMVQSLTKNQLFYDRNGTAKWWILVVERFVGANEPAALPVSAHSPWSQPRDEIRGGEHAQEAERRAETSAS